MEYDTQGLKRQPPPDWPTDHFGRLVIPGIWHQLLAPIIAGTVTNPTFACRVPPALVESCGWCGREVARCTFGRYDDEFSCELVREVDGTIRCELTAIHDCPGFQQDFKGRIKK